MSDSTEIVDKDKKTSSAAFWITVIVLLPIMYVLSIGPAWWLLSRYPAIEQSITAFYYPLLLLMESNDWLEPIMARYLSWWV